MPLERRLRAPAAPECLDGIHDLLEQLFDDHTPVVPLQDRVRFATAVIEVAGNIVAHACGPTPVDIDVLVALHPDRVEAQLLDNGVALTVRPGSTSMPDVMAEHGRGLRIASSAVDELSYVRTGSTNAWRVVRHLQN